MPREITSSEVVSELKQLKLEVAVLFRCVDGPPCAYIFHGLHLSDGERGIYQVVGFAAEMDHPADEERFGLGVINCMRWQFQELWGRGARTIAFRRDFEMSILSGGDRVPDVIRLSARICAFNVNGVRVPVGEWEWPEGCPPKFLTREQVQDGRP